MTDHREKRLAELVLELKGLKAEKRELMKTCKDRIDDMQDRVDALARDIRSGQKTISDLVADIAPKPGSGIDSVTIAVEGAEPVTLTQEDGKRLRARGSRA